MSAISIFANLRRFKSATSGAVAMVAALTAIPLFGIAGIAVDLAVQNARQADFQAAADAAVLAGVKATTERLTAGANSSAAKNAGKQAAETYFKAQASNWPATRGKFKIDIELDGTEVRGKGEYTGKMSTYITQLIGVSTLNISAVSEVASGVAPAVDFHILVDVSASMGIGASTADIERMNNANGCAFACHAPTGMAGFGNTVDTAHAAGARLRIDVVRDELLSFVDQLQLDRNLGNRVAVHTFSNTVQTLANLTGNEAQIDTALQNIRLTSSWGEGGTDFAEALGTLAARLENDARLDSNRKRFVILLTDGVATNVRYSQTATNNWGTDPNFVVFSPVFNGDGNTPFSMQGFDEAQCDALKRHDLASVFVINTEYVIPRVGTDGDGRFSLIEANLKDDIQRHLQACATNSEYAFEAGTSQELTSSISQIIRMLELNTLRLTH